MRQTNDGGRREDCAFAQTLCPVGLESLECRMLFAAAPLPCVAMAGPVHGTVPHHPSTFALQRGTGDDDRQHLYMANAAHAKQPQVVVLPGGRRVVARHGKKGGATVGLLHPGEGGGSRGQTDGEGGRSSGAPAQAGSSTSGGGVVSSASETGNTLPRSIGTLNWDQQSSSGAVVFPDDQSSVTRPASAQSDPVATQLRASILSATQNVARPAVTATFAIAPLVIREFEVVSREISAAVADAPERKGVPLGLHSHSHDALVTEISDAVESTKAVMVNLFHVDAAATFNDAMQSLIEESAAGAAVVHPIGHRRAWTITAAVFAADLALVTYWFALRRPRTADEPKTAAPRRFFLPFGAEPVRA